MKFKEFFIELNESHELNEPHEYDVKKLKKELNKNPDAIVTIDSAAGSTAGTTPGTTDVNNVEHSGKDIFIGNDEDGKEVEFSVSAVVRVNV